MQYMLDTNTCIAIIKNKPVSIRRKLSVIPVGQVGISSIVLSELRFGVSKSTKSLETDKSLHEFLPFIEVLDYPGAAAKVYGDIRLYLQTKGTPIGSNDLLIAAHCLYVEAVFVTHNTREFNRVPNLRCDDWLI